MKQFKLDLKNWRFYAAASITFILGLFFAPEVVETITPFLEWIYTAPDTSVINTVLDSIPVIDTAVIDTTTIDTIVTDTL